MSILILAGGLGSRLRSVVSDKPKAMADINGKPFIEYQVNMLRKQTNDKIIFCTGYLGEQIEEYFNYSDYKDIYFSYESEPLGTGGAIKNAEKFIYTDYFIVLNGDTYVDFNLNLLIDDHLKNNADFSLMLREVENPSRYGAVDIDNNNHVISFNEKNGNTSTSKLINSGVYVINKDILELISANSKVSIENELLPLLLKENYKILGHKYYGYFIDIGVPDDYFKFNNDIIKLGESK